MGSQTDLDQGGTARQWALSYMGPSVGWVRVPLQNVLAITAAGTYTLDPSTSVVTVNIAGAVTIILPSAIQPSEAGAGMTQPSLFAQTPVTVVDIGGNANSHPITIEPAVGTPTQNIMGLSSIQITVNYGGFTLFPNSSLKGWNSISP